MAQFDFTQQDLITAYQLLEAFRRPARLKRILNASFGSGEASEALRAKLASAIDCTLRNVGLSARRTDEDKAIVWARVARFMAALGEGVGMKVTKRDATKLIVGVKPADLNRLRRLVNVMESKNAPHSCGYFEVAEMVLGLANFLAAKDSWTGASDKDYSSSLVAYLERIRAMGQANPEWMAKGYPLDALVHDVAHIVSNPKREIVIDVRREYASSYLFDKALGHVAGDLVQDGLERIKIAA